MQQDLDVLAALVGKLVVKGPNVRRIFEEAFRIMEGQQNWTLSWQRFVGQVYMLRGKKTETKNVAFRFWEQCRAAESNAKAAEEDDDEDIIVLGD